MEIILLFIGAMLGVLFSEMYNKVIVNKITQYKTEKFREMRRAIYSDPEIHLFIQNYYKERDAYEELFNYEVQNYSGKILFLTSPEWSSLRIDIFRNNNILHFVDSEKTNFEIDNRMIEKRKKYGQRIFPAECLVLSRALEVGCIEVKKCSFYEKLTLIDRLENETYKAAKCRNKRRLKYRDCIMGNFKSALCEKNQPVSLGCHVIFALKLNGKIKIALHERSQETFTYGGYWASIPVFGIVPIPLQQNRNDNILLYNILKEYSEELFDRTVLAKEERHVSPFWFYSKFPETIDILKSLEKRESECLMLGYGFDAINGLSIIASLLYVSDEVLAEKILNTCRVNWEVKSQVIFYDLDAPEIMTYFKEKRYQTGTAYALSLAIKYLEEKMQENGHGV